MKEWGLDHIPIIITDSGAYMVKAFKEAKSSNSSELIDETIEEVVNNSARSVRDPVLPHRIINHKILHHLVIFPRLKMTMLCFGKMSKMK